MVLLQTIPNKVPAATEGMGVITMATEGDTLVAETAPIMAT